MMDTVKKMVFIFWGAVLWHGCAVGDDERPGPGNGGVAVSLSAAGIGSEQDATRAAAPEPLAEGSTVRIVAYTDASLSAASYSGEGCYVMDGGTLTPCTTDADGEMLSKGGATDGLWLRGGESYHFFAVTPAVAVDATQTPPASNVKNLTDFASSLTPGAGSAGITVAKGASAVSVTLNTLERRCARVTFAFDRVWTNVTRTEIQSATLTQMTDEPQQAAGTGNLPADATHTQTVTFGKAHFTTDAASSWLASGGAAVLPKASGGLDLTLGVCFNGNTTPTELKATGISPLVFQKGLSYTFRVKLKDGVVVLVLEIEKWTRHDSGGNAGTPPSGEGVGPWEGNGSGGDAGAPPVAIVIGEWKNIVWGGSSGDSPGGIQSPDWEGSASDGIAGNGPAALWISGWRSTIWSGSVGGSSAGTVPDSWTNNDIVGEVG